MNFNIFFFSLLLLGFWAGCASPIAYPTLPPQGISTSPKTSPYLKSLCRSPKTQRDKKVLLQAIQNSLDRAVTYLSHQYRPDSILDDPYYRCVDQPAGCDPFYRKLDAAMELAYTIDVPDLVQDPRLGKIKKASDEYAEKIYRQWSGEPIGQKAIETYSAFAYYHPQARAMIQRIEKAYHPEYKGWIPPHYYAYAWSWRKVYDESWPVMALAKYHVPFSVFKLVVENHIEMAKKIMKGQSINEKADLAIVSTLFVELQKIQENGYDMALYKEMKAQALTWFVRKVRQRSWETQGQMIGLIVFFSNYGYSDRTFLDQLVCQAIQKQESDGSWGYWSKEEEKALAKGNPRFNRKNLRVVTTLSGAIALAKYKTKILLPELQNKVQPAYGGSSTK